MKKKTSVGFQKLKIILPGRWMKQSLNGVLKNKKYIQIVGVKYLIRRNSNNNCGSKRT